MTGGSITGTTQWPLHSMWSSSSNSTLSARSILWKLGIVSIASAYSQRTPESSLAVCFPLIRCSICTCLATNPCGIKAGSVLLNFAIPIGVRSRGMFDAHSRRPMHVNATHLGAGFVLRYGVGPPPLLLALFTHCTHIPPHSLSSRSLNAVRSWLRSNGRSSESTHERWNIFELRFQSKLNGDVTLSL